MRGGGRESGRFGSEVVADARYAQRRQRAAALVLQRALQPLVEIARGGKELLERFGGRLRARQDGEKTEAAVALRVHGLELEGAGAGERGRAQHRSVRVVGLVK